MHCPRLTFLLFLLAIPATCFSWSAKVVSVADGDTITVLHNDQKKEIRLYGIDCPEKGQSHGEQAKALTIALVSGRNVDVEQKDIDRYGRVVGLVKVDGQSLSELIVQNGYAWVYTKYCKEKFCADWAKSEAVSRQQKKRDVARLSSCATVGVASSKERREANCVGIRTSSDIDWRETGNCS